MAAGGQAVEPGLDLRPTGQVWRAVALHMGRAVFAIDDEGPIGGGAILRLTGARGSVNDALRGAEMGLGQDGIG
ncbi:hypothetical protein JCM17478_36640 [Thermopirellula anaerolimosa]